MNGIFFLEGSDFNWKEEEYKLLQSFETSLTPEERQDVKTYIDYLKWDTSDPDMRRRRNLAIMTFMDGVRYQKRKANKAAFETMASTPRVHIDEVFTNALFQVASEELSKWSGIKKENINRTLNDLAWKRVEENFHNAQNSLTEKPQDAREPAPDVGGTI